MKAVRREYYGEHLYRDVAIAMDEAPARESERKDDKDDDGGPSFGDLNAALDEATAALDAIRTHLKRGAADAEKRFSFDAVKRRIADASEALDELAGHLGGSSAEDEEPGEREEASARARDGERTDHRRDFDPAKARGTTADSRRGLALDQQRAAADLDLAEIFRPSRPQGDSADAASLHEIFAPTGR
jgi:hypothetical protein